METDVDRYGAPQCKAPQMYDGQIYYCLRPEGHKGPHQNDTVPHGAEQSWDHERARDVQGATHDAGQAKRVTKISYSSGGVGVIVRVWYRDSTVHGWDLRFAGVDDVEYGDVGVSIIQEDGDTVNNIPYEAIKRVKVIR